MADDAHRKDIERSAVSAPLIDVGTHALKRTRHGYMVYLKTDVHVGRSIDVYGEYSEHEVKLFEQILKPGMTVVDGGANFGTHTVFFSKAVGPTGQVYAFEPQRLIFQVLCANMALNGIENTHCLQAGLGASRRDGIIPTLDIRKYNNTGAFTFDTALQGDRVPIMPLDELNLPELHFFKLDVEGMELDALKGAKFTINYRQPVLYVENTFDRPTYEPQQSRDLVNYILELGYKAYWHWPPVFNPDNFYGVKENYFPGVASWNLICIPKSADVNIDALPVVRDDDPLSARKRLAETDTRSTTKK